MVNMKSLHPERRESNAKSGTTFIELVIVLVILSFLLTLAAINLLSVLRKNTFKGQAQEIVSLMQMAATSASETGRRYEISIDLTEQSYMLREITSSDLSEVLEEDIVDTRFLSSRCRIWYVLYDDLMMTDEQHQLALFRVGRNGWQYGGKIVLMDDSDQEYSIVVNRLNRVVRLERGDVQIMLGRSENEIPF
jgi:competence protein ComGC